MAKTTTAIKNTIGRFNPFKRKPTPPTATGGVPASPLQPLPPSSHGAMASVPTPSLSGLTAEELQARRRAVLASVSFDVPFHRRVLNGVKNLWRIIGPFCFVLFTAWEVFYFISSFMPPDEAWTSKVLLWGITLLIEIPFMMATYDQAERKAVIADRRARGETVRDRDTAGSLIAWLFLAAVNVAGQVAFLVLITKLGGNPFSDDPRMLGLWFFVVMRVSGVLVGDTYTAFFLRPDESSIERVLRTQEAQMQGEKLLADSDAQRLRSEAETDAQIRRIKVSVERDEREAAFMADWQHMNMQQTLERQKQFMIAERSRMREINGVEEEPQTGDL
jgi:hypothetical protein